jgi:subtilisin family serine protease
VQDPQKEEMMRKILITIIAIAIACLPADAKLDGRRIFFFEQDPGHPQLDEQAYIFVGIPFVTDTSNATIAIIDGWDDGHGQTVEAIVRRGAQNANILRLDFVEKSSSCPPEPLVVYVNCVQNVIADLVEAAASQDGMTIVNMSIGLYYLHRGSPNRIFEEKGCEQSDKLNLESLKRIAKTIREAPKDKIFVAAAGNYGLSGRVGFPACLERVYSAASLMREKQYDPQNLRIAFYSNYSIIGRSYAEPIGGVMVDWGGYKHEGTSFAAPLLSALLANMVAMCYKEPSKLNPSYKTQREGMSVLTIWSAEC